MNQPAYQLPRGAQPIGTPTPVVPTQPGQVMLPGHAAAAPAPNGAPNGVVYTQGQQMPPQGGPSQVPGYSQEALSRPEILDRITSEQNAAADPQKMAEQANNLRLEQMLAESNQRAADQAAQLNQAVQLMSTTSQQQAEYQRQQMEMARLQMEQQNADRLAQQQRPWEHPSLQLDSDTLQTFEESIPVIDTLSRRNAMQIASETVQNTVNPQVQALNDKIAALETQVQNNARSVGSQFADSLMIMADEYGVDLNSIESEPAFIEYSGEVSNQITGQTIGQDVKAALTGGQPHDLRVLRTVFKNYAQRRDGDTQTQHDLPPQGGGAREHTVHASTQAQEPSQLSHVQEQGAQLEQYRASLMNQLRRQQISVSDFQDEIAKVESGMDALINQTQT